MARNQRTIQLCVDNHNILLNLGDESDGTTVGDIITDLHSGDPDDTDYNHMIDGLESLVLAHACAGVDIQSEQYLMGIADAIYAISNNS